MQTNFNEVSRENFVDVDRDFNHNTAETKRLVDLLDKNKAERTELTEIEDTFIYRINNETAARVEADNVLLSNINTRAIKATTLFGYGITDAYTKLEIDGKVVLIQGDISTLSDSLTALGFRADTIESIAKGASRAFVFQTLAELNAWLEIPTNVSTLRIGDNLFIVQLDVPDFWWDGTQKQQLETGKVDLSNIYTIKQVDALIASRAPISNPIITGKLTASDTLSNTHVFESKNIGGKAFENDVPNQKFDVIIDPKQLLYTFKLRVGSHWAHVNGTGYIEKQFTILVNYAEAPTIFYTNSSDYTNLTGFAGYRYAIDEARIEDGKIKIAIASRTLYANEVGVVLICEAAGVNLQSPMDVDAFSLSEVYTTDETVLPAPRTLAMELAERLTNVDNTADKEKIVRGILQTDSRNINPGPFDDTAFPGSYSGGIFSDFKANHADLLNDGGTYHRVLTYRAWSDMSGGKSSQLAFTDNGNLWMRTAHSETDWGEWERFLKSDDIQTVQVATSTEKGIALLGATGGAARFGVPADAAAVPINTTNIALNPISYLTDIMTSEGVKITLPFGAQSEAMFAFTVRMYAAYECVDIQFSGYLYEGIGTWYAPRAIMIAGSRAARIIMGIDNAGKAYVWIAGPSNYAGVGVFNLVGGYTPQNWNNGWTITQTNEVENVVVDETIYPPAQINSPAFTGAPTAPTAYVDTNDNQIATTAFVKMAIESGTGVAGQDAISIDISHSALLIPADSSSAIPGSEAITVKALKGSIAQNVIVEGVGNLPDGLYAVIQNNNMTTVPIIIEWTPLLSDISGSISISIIVDGKSFTRNISWALVRPGAPSYGMLGTMVL